MSLSLEETPFSASRAGGRERGRERDREGEREGERETGRGEGAADARPSQAFEGLVTCCLSPGRSNEGRDPKGRRAFLQDTVQCPPMVGVKFQYPPVVGVKII